MTTIIHNRTEFRIYNRDEFLPIRRDLFAQGFRIYDTSDGSLAGTEVLKAIIASWDAIGNFNTIVVAKKI